ncbi:MULTISPECIES: chemotaxis protein [Bacillaceae]|uniref:chemotaxis protein n=1 Tax=Bacillaceae TaxID=186817 RepID=UPI0030006D02
MDTHKQIESGSNQLDIMEFKVGVNTYGINVLKVRELVEARPFTPIPLSHPYIMGVSELRGRVLPVINLSKVLGLQNHQFDGTCKWIITEMNQQVVAFQVDTVNGIRRLTWENIETPSNTFHNDASLVVGIVKLEDNITLLLDFEKILTEINPATGINETRIGNIEPKVARDKKHILIAEDSSFLIELIQTSIQKSGYQHVTIKSNGKEMWDYLEAMVQTKGDRVLEEIDCLITDIEMPQMDGLHLTKRVKDHAILKELPVVIFSSLITEDLRHKGESVGANAQISKPEIEALVNILDSLLLK